MRISIVAAIAEEPMVSLSIFCIVTGALLGLRFKVLVFIPVTAFGVFLVLVANLSSGTGAWWATTLAALAAASLQLGYLGGAVIGLPCALHQPPTTAIRDPGFQRVWQWARSVRISAPQPPW